MIPFKQPFLQQYLPKLSLNPQDHSRRLSFEEGFDPLDSDFGDLPPFEIEQQQSTPNNSTLELEQHPKSKKQAIADPSHQMVTKAKAGVHKPKKYHTEYQLFLAKGPTAPIVPSSVTKAIESRLWKFAMEDELHALKRNNTWSLGPYSPSLNIVRNKWVFRVTKTI